MEKQESNFNNSIIRIAVIPFAIFVLLFFGVGFISGGVVHLGEGFNLWDISLVGMGVLLFVTGSYIQEVIFNKKNLINEGIIPFLVYSLILSIGVGMASGGIQHFVDTPHYARFLIPVGLTVGLIAFILKQNIKLASQQWTRLIVSSILAALLLGITLTIAAKKIPVQPSSHHSDPSHHSEEIQLDSNTTPSDHMNNEDHPHN